MRSSYAQGHPPVGKRDGYRVIRKAGRYMVFPRAALSEVRNKYGPRDGLVEIWNGMPFLSPLWAIGPRMVFLHHLHGEMWKMTLPPNLARMGEILEYRIAPPLYRRTPVVTLSQSSRDELIHEGFPARHGLGGVSGRRPAVLARRRALAHAARGRGRAPGPGQALRPLDQDVRRGAPAPPDARAGDHERGLREARAGGAGRRARRRLVGPLRGSCRRRRADRPLPPGMGARRARRRARGGA